MGLEQKSSVLSVNGTVVLLVFPKASVSILICRAMEASNSVAEVFVVDPVHANSSVVQVEVAFQIP